MALLLVFWFWEGIGFGLLFFLISDRFLGPHRDPGIHYRVLGPTSGVLHSLLKILSPQFKVWVLFPSSRVMSPQ